MLQKTEGGRIYDLNISEKYVPEWGAWEVGREIISNAIDADKLGYKVVIKNKDKIIVTTRTKPTLAQIKFIGGGTKSASTGTIGCFGEGIKLAAMVCKRLGGDMKINFENYEISYDLQHDEDLGHRSILMHVKDVAEYFDGMAIEISLENIAREVSGKFLPSSEPGMVEKVDAEKMLIYNKGVFVAEKPTRSLYDWNLNTGVNRDRNVIDFWDIGNAIASLIDNKIDMKLARRLLESDAGTFEVDCISKHSYKMGARSARAFLDAVKDIHGTDIVIATDDADANRLAKRNGKKVILIDDTFRRIIQTISPEDRPPTSEEIITHEDKLNIDYSAKHEMADLNFLMEVLETPVEIFIFEGQSKDLGYADFKDGRRRIYLNRILFEVGHKAQKYATFIHEIAHINSKASDATFNFEDEIGRLAGKVAKFMIDVREKPLQ